MMSPRGDDLGDRHTPRGGSGEELEMRTKDLEQLKLVLEEYEERVEGTGYADKQAKWTKLHLLRRLIRAVEKQLHSNQLAASRTRMSRLRQDKGSL